MTPANRRNSTSLLATLFPGYFALVMATGIIAIAAWQQDVDWLAHALYVVAAAGYVVLGIMLPLRIVFHWGAFVADVTNHMKGFAYLTTVAGTNVLGSASAIIHGWWGLAWGLWCVSLALWVGFVYTTLIAIVTSADKPALGGGINGTWFLLTVSTQSVVVLGALLLDRHESDVLAFGLVAAFALGIVLYLIVMTMVFLRWTFHPWNPVEVDPPAWIAAGAVAITVLAGSNLLVATPESDRLLRVATFIEGLTVLAWATATFWFPLMIAIGVWRHLVHKVPLRYHPSYWSLVFPIGMYSAATFRMSGAIGLTAIDRLPQLALVAALLAWSATFVGLAHLGTTTGRQRLARAREQDTR